MNLAIGVVMMLINQNVLVNSNPTKQDVLAHWVRGKIAAISQTTFSDPFSWIKVYGFRLRLHWNLFLGFELVVHDDVIKRKHFSLYWTFVPGIHRSPLNSPHKGQWRGALMFSLICARINGWLNNGEASDLRRHRAHYDVIVIVIVVVSLFPTIHRNIV